MSQNIILKAENIHKTYTVGKIKQPVLRGLDLEIKEGEFIAIMGASGSGKSTLLHILGLLDKPDQGKVTFQGNSLFDLSTSKQDQIRRRDIGFVFQFYHLLPELNVAENIMLPSMVDSSIISWFAKRHQAKSRVSQLLKEVGLEAKAHQMPTTLSGGERQRTALARALIQNPTLLLADEPTGNLDSVAGKSILNLLTKLNNQGQTIIMVTHDNSIAELAHRKLILRDGKIG